MAITLIDTVASNNGGATTIVMSVPINTDGNVLIMQITARGGTSTTITTPSGWTLLNSVTSGTTLIQSIYWKVANSEPSSYTVTLTSNKASGTITSLGGAKTTSLSSINYAGQATTSTTCTAPSVSTATSVNVMRLFLDGMASGGTVGNPTGWVSGNQLSSTGGSTGTRTTSGVAYLNGSGTSFGSVTSTNSTNAVTIGHQVVITEEILSSGNSNFLQFF